MKRFRRGPPLGCVLLPLGLLLLPIVAHAALRPGGGQSFSGAGSSGSSGSSGGDGHGSGGDAVGGLIDVLLLCVEYPKIGIPILIVTLGYGTISYVRRAKMNAWSTRNQAVLEAAAADAAAQVAKLAAATRGIPRSDIERIRGIDPDFSVVLFEDFLYTLYTHVQASRPKGGLSTLAAYLSDQVRLAIGQDRTLESVSGIVIGAMHFTSIRNAEPTDSAPVQIVGDFEVNRTEVRHGQPIRYFVVERLTLARAHGVQSRPPERARVIDCPNCGAPLQSVEGDVCSYCKQHVGHGRFDWMVTTWVQLTSETRPPLLTSDVEEKGTDLPTVVDPSARDRFVQLTQRDRTFDWKQFEARVQLVFEELQVAWSNRDWLKARPFVTDNYFQSQVYWMKLYIEQKARNVTENAKIEKIEAANLSSDKYFDAITVRVFASSLDYTISDEGRLLSGSRTKVRAYSEYWTFVRGVGRTVHPTKATAECPNCGAPLKISMVGNCEHCNAKVTTGEFDWVLSRVEQDDVYTG